MLNSRLKIGLFLLMINLLVMGIGAGYTLAFKAYGLFTLTIADSMFIIFVALCIINHEQLQRPQGSVQAPTDTDAESGDSNHFPTLAQGPYPDYQLHHFPDWRMN